MSVVTAVTLICSLTDGEGDHDGELSRQITDINEWLAERDFGPLVNVAAHSGGTKHPQCCTFHCGYNHFYESEFTAVALSMLWQDPENFVLVIQPEEGPTRVFTEEHVAKVVPVFPRRPS